MKGKKLTICLVVMLALCICFGSALAFADGEATESGSAPVGSTGGEASSAPTGGEAPSAPEGETMDNGAGKSGEGTQGGGETTSNTAGEPTGEASCSENNFPDASRDGEGAVLEEQGESTEPAEAAPVEPVADRTEEESVEGEEPTTEDTTPDNNEENEEPQDETSADAAVSGSDPVPVSGDEKTEDTSTGYEVHFGDAQEVTIPGGVIPPGDILTALGMEGEVTAASGSNDALFTIARDENGVWQFTSHNAFSTEKTMTLIINGEEVTVRVTNNNVMLMKNDDTDVEKEIVQKAIEAAGAVNEINLSLKGHLTENATIGSGKTGTIDLCGFTLTGNITNNGTLTINNTLVDEQTDNGMMTGTVTNHGTLTIEGGSIGAEIDTYDSSTLTIYGATFTAEIDAHDSSVVVIEGSVFNEEVESRDDSTMTVNGGTSITISSLPAKRASSLTPGACE